MTSPGFKIVNSRRFAFAKDQIYQAISDPTQLVKWWGPHGFRNEFQTFDLRVGGFWRFTMISEDEKRFDNIKEFTEISPDRIAFRHHEPMHDFTMSMRFEGDAAHCDLTWEMDFAPGADPALETFIQAANEQNFDRLQTILEIENDRRA